MGKNMLVNAQDRASESVVLSAKDLDRIVKPSIDKQERVREFELDEDEFVSALRLQVQRMGGEHKAAEAWGISYSYLCNIICGRRGGVFGPKITKLMGFERVTYYRRTVRE
jgi:hypothetical protein